MPNISRTLLESPEYWAAKDLKQLQMARTNYKYKKRPMPIALADELAKREAAVAQARAEAKAARTAAVKRPTTNCESPEHWTGKTLRQLQTACAYYKHKKRPLPNALAAELEKRGLHQSKKQETAEYWASKTPQQLRVARANYKRRNLPLPRALTEELARHDAAVAERRNNTPQHTAEYWTDKTPRQLQTARAHYKHKKCPLPNALVAELEKRGLHQSKKQETAEYWASKTPQQLRVARANYKRRNLPLPRALADELAKRQESATHAPRRVKATKTATAPQPRVTSIDATPTPSGINIVTKTPAGCDFRGNLYDIYVNGKIIAPSRVNPTLETVMDDHLLVLRDGWDELYEIYDAYAAPYEIKRPNPNITRVIPTNDSVLLYMADFATEVIRPTDIPTNAPRYDLSNITVDKTPTDLPPRPTPDTDAEINLDDGHYHLFTKKTPSNFYDVYLNGVKIMHQVPGISAQTFFDDRLLGIRISNFNQRFNDWYLFDANMRLYRPNYKFPLNIKIQDITRDGARLKLYMSNGDMQYLDCRHLLAYKTASHIYKIHD